MPKYAHLFDTWRMAERRCSSLRSAYFDEIVATGYASLETRTQLHKAIGEVNAALADLLAESKRSATPFSLPTSKGEPANSAGH